MSDDTLWKHGWSVCSICGFRHMSVMAIGPNGEYEDMPQECPKCHNMSASWEDSDG